MKLEQLKKELHHFFNYHLHIHRGERTPVEVIRPDGNTNNFTRIIYGDYELIVVNGIMKKFIEIIESFDRNQYDQLAKLVFSQDERQVRIRPSMDVSLIGEDTEDNIANTYQGALGVNFTKVDEIFDAAFNSIKQDFEGLARYLVQASKAYNEDNNVPKLKDVYFFFNTEKSGIDTEFFISPTYVEPTAVDPNQEPNRSPIKESEMLEFFGYPSANPTKAENGITIKDEIEAAMERVNKRIKDAYRFDQEKLGFPITQQLLTDKINGVLIPVVVTMRLQPFSTFGVGVNAIDMAEGKTPNAIAVGDKIDEEVRKVIEHLKSIPFADGTKAVKFSMEVDSFGIYGRDENNELVETVVDPQYQFATTFQSRYSDGFTKAFSNYIKTIKNDYFFQTNGTSVEAIKDENEVRIKAAESLLEGWAKAGVPPKVKVQLEHDLKESGHNWDLNEEVITKSLSGNQERWAVITYQLLRKIAYKAAGAEFVEDVYELLVDENDPFPIDTVNEVRQEFVDKALESIDLN